MDEPHPGRALHEPARHAGVQAPAPGDKVIELALTDRVNLNHRFPAALQCPVFERDYGGTPRRRYGRRCARF